MTIRSGSKRTISTSSGLELLHYSLGCYVEQFTSISSFTVLISFFINDSLKKKGKTKKGWDANIKMKYL